MDDTLPVAPPVSSNDPIRGDLKPVDIDPVQAGVQEEVDDRGNVVVNPSIAESGRDDLLYDGNGNDLVYGFGGNDTIMGPGSGDDLLDGGSGDDFLSAGGGADTVIGGQGLDRVVGGPEDNRLYADEQLTDEQVIASNVAEESILARGDLLSANSGNDLAAGSVRNDLLMGGSGRDSLYGSGGNDVIYGDQYTAWVTSDWRVDRNVEITPGGPSYSVAVSEMDSWLANETDDDKDFLFGGAGDDWLFGQNGQDYLEGNSGHDLLAGGKSSDVLVGGEGNDLLLGDEGRTSTGQDGGDILLGGGGNDSLYGDGGSDSLYGGADNDYLAGDNANTPELQGSDWLDGGSGNDTLAGFGGNDTLEGDTGNDVLLGDDSNQQIAAALHGRDLLRGGTGNDSLYGGGNADELYGGDDADLLVGDASPSNLSISAHGADTLYGEQGTDTLYGMGGNDRLDGGSENDFLFGDFSDTEQQGDGDDILIGGSGNDSLYGAGGNDRLQGGSDNDLLAGGTGNDTYVINAGDGVDVISDASGSNNIEFGAGITAGSLSFNKTYNTQLETVLQISYGTSAVNIVGGYSGAVSLFRFSDGTEKTLEQLLAASDGVALNASEAGGNLDGTGGQDTLLGAAGHDVLRGNQGHDLLDGGRGDDALEGGAGNDTLLGGGGNDYLSGGAGDDSLAGGGGADTLVGGAGTNEYVFEAGMGADTIISTEQESIILRLKSGYELSDIVYRYEQSDLILESKSDGSTLRIKDYLDTLPEFSFAVGGVLTSAGDFLTPEAQSYSQTLESLERGFKAVLLADYTQDMTLSNGRYSWSYVFDSAYKHEEIRYNHDISFVDISLEGSGEVGPSGYVNLSSYDIYEKTVYQLLMGGGSSSLIPDNLGNDARMIIGGQPIGLNSSDTGINILGVYDEQGGLEGWFLPISPWGGLQEGSRNSVLFTHRVYEIKREFVIGHGSSGDDNYVAKDGSIFYGNAGNDTISTGLTAVEPGEFPHNVVGSMLSGGEGDDIIYGGNRNDVIIGGDGNDTLFGYNGEDNYVFMDGYGVDVVFDANYDYGYEYSDEELEAAWPRNSNDTVTLAEGAKLENITLSWGEVFIEADYRDGVLDYFSSTATKVKETYATLDIAWGADQIIRIVMPHANDPQSTGIEFIKFADGSSMTLADLINGRLTLPYPDVLGRDQSIFNADDYTSAPIIGGNGNDTIGGNGYLIGRDGNDTLQSSDDINVLIGGAGSDTYEFAYGWGEDMLDNYDVGSDKIDRVVFGMGVNAADIEVAWDGNDLFLTHLDTGDSLTIKNYYLSNGQSQYRLEQIVFADGTVWEYDDILNWQPIGESSEIWGTEDSDSLQGTAGDDLIYGYGGDDTLTGNAGNDLLQGGSGADRMSGNAGDDAYVVDDVADVVIENLDEGVDSVESAISYRLGANVENLGLVGSEAINGSGNSASNEIYGNDADNFLKGYAGDDLLVAGSGNDSLDGGVGTDTLWGGEGNDTYYVDAIADEVIEYADEGVDSVRASISYSLTENVENLTLLGTASINSAGNSLANTLKGNDAANRLSGGLGNDSLYGGLGNDTYLFSAGDGADRITDTDSTTGNFDQLKLSDVEHDQLWFRSVGNHLEVQIIGTSDRVTINNWNLGGANQLEQIIAGDDFALSSSQVANLVNAMAAFAPPPMGQVELSVSQHASLDAVIAANWQ